VPPPAHSLLPLDRHWVSTVMARYITLALALLSSFAWITEAHVSGSPSTCTWPKPPTVMQLHLLATVQCGSRYDSSTTYIFPGFNSPAQVYEIGAVTDGGTSINWPAYSKSIQHTRSLCLITRWPFQMPLAYPSLFRRISLLANTLVIILLTAQMASADSVL
jgi:hypothetical protein